MWPPCSFSLLLVAVVTSVLGNRATELCGDETGYSCLFLSKEEEVSNQPIYFDKELPSWLTGTLIRNGPGLFERPKQSVSHVFDGLAKLLSWKFFPNGTTVFSTRFVRSRVYQETMKRDAFAPYILFAPPNPEFKGYQIPQCLRNGIDNMDVNVYDFPSENPDKTFGVLGDFWKLYQISGSDLSTMKYIKPRLNRIKIGFLDMLSSAHPLPEPGTKNRLTFLIRQKTFRRKNRLVLARMSSLSGRSVVAEWKVKDSIPYMHSFSVTQTKAIMLAAPYVGDYRCLFKRGAPLPCMYWSKDKQSTLYIVDLKTRKKSTIKMPALFVTHHINAYDTSKDRIIMDVASYDNPDGLKMLLMDVIKNPDKRTKSYMQPINKRIHVDLTMKTVRIVDLSSRNSMTDGVDMPTINEDYRSRKYCFVYGPVNFSDGKSFTSTSVIKKNVCDGGKVVGRLSIPFHYPIESVFVPNPRGHVEDDGVLMVPFLRGKEVVNYMAVVDAKTMTIISQADIPQYVTFSFHGRFFKDFY